MSAARDDITVYWGVASGSTHAALHRHYEGHPDYQNAPSPTHAMVSWLTENNQVWEGPNWMIDSGGAPDTIKRFGGHPKSIDDYIDYLRAPPTRFGDDLSKVTIDKFALRDWPCEPDVRSALGLSVEELQHRTLVDHINMLERVQDENLNAEPVAVLQGWHVQDYLECIDLYRDHGLLTDEVAIGTLCGRRDTAVIRNTSWRVARNLPGRINLHGFGVKQSALSEPDALAIFDSVDTAAWDQSLRFDTRDGVQRGPPGGHYADWVQWDDRNNPRMTARNLWIAYRAYARQLAAIEKVETPSNVRVATLDQFDPEARTDEYLVYKCVCDMVIDPGRPHPLVHYDAYFNLGTDLPEKLHSPVPDSPPMCRHCERLETDIYLRRIDLEDEIMAKGLGATFRRAARSDFEDGWIDGGE